MKEFLKSFRRKMAFVLALLLVLGNVNWEVVAFAEGTVAPDGPIQIMLTHYDRDNYFIKTNFIDNNCDSLTIDTATYGDYIQLACMNTSDYTADLVGIEGQDIDKVEKTIEENRIHINIKPKESSNEVITLNITPVEKYREKFAKQEGISLTINKVERRRLNNVDTITSLQVKNGDNWEDWNKSTLIYGNVYKLVVNKPGETDPITGESVQTTVSCSAEKPDDGEGSANDLVKIKEIDGEDAFLITPLCGEGTVNFYATVSSENNNYTSSRGFLGFYTLDKKEQSEFTTKGNYNNQDSSLTIYQSNDENTKNTITFNETNNTFTLTNEDEAGFEYSYVIENNSDGAVEELSDNTGYKIVKTGEVTFAVTKKERTTTTPKRYNDKTQEYVVKIVPATDDNLISNLVIKSGDKSVESIFADKDNDREITLSATLADGASVEYSSSDPKVKKKADTKDVFIIPKDYAGIVTFTAKATKNNYNSKEISKALEVKKNDNVIVIADLSNVSYEKDGILTVNATAIQGIVKYELEGTTDVVEKIGTDPSDGRFKIKKAGTFNIKVSTAGGYSYNAAENVIEITVKPKAADLINSVTAVYNDKSVASNGAITYAPNAMVTFNTTVYKQDENDPTVTYAVDNSTVAEFDETNVLKIKKAGSVKVTVTAKMDNYETKTYDFNLNINPATQNLTWGAKPEQFTNENDTDVLYYGISDFTYSVSSSHICDEDCENKAVQYEISQSNNYASVDNSGKVTLNYTEIDKATLPLTITVKAKKDACAKYAYAENSYSFEIKQFVGGNGKYTISSTSTPTNGWYKDDVVIKPADNDYQISTQRWGDYSDSITLNASNTYQNLTYYIKKKSGWSRIEQITVSETICIDKTNPTYPGDSIVYDDTNRQTWKETLSMGFYKSPVKVTLTAIDEHSGITKFIWDSGEGTDQNEVTTGIVRGDVGKYSVTIEVPKPYKGKIRFWAVDQVGNAGAAQDGKRNIVIEDVAPELILENPEYKTQGLQNTTDESVYYNNSTGFTLKIKEENFDGNDFNNSTYNLGTFTINNEAVNPTWEASTSETEKNVHTANLTFNEERSYKIDLKYTDPSSNGTILFTSKNIIVDKTKPSRNVQYSTPTFVTKADGSNEDAYNPNRENQDVKLYYDSPATITVKVTDVNFNPEFMQIKKGSGDGQFPAELDNVTWNKVDDEANTYEAVITINGNGSYQYIVRGKDYANNEMPVLTTETIIVDSEAPGLTAAFLNGNVNQNTVSDGTDKKFYKVSSDPFASDEFITLQVKVVTNNFRASDMKFVSSELANKTVPNTEQTYSAYCADKNNWTQGESAGVHLLNILFPTSEEQQFSFTLDYKGLNQKDAAQVAGTVVVDSTAPQLTDQTTYSETTIREDGRVGYVYGDTAVVNLQIRETNFNKQDVNLWVHKNGSRINTGYEVTEWQSTGNLHTCQITLGTESDKDGDYQVFVTYTDRSHNKMTDYVSQYIIIDSAKPVMSITYENEVTLQNEGYYPEPRKATITVEDRSIVDKENQLEFSITAKNITNTDVSIPTENISDWSKTWLNERNTYKWTKVVELTVDAIYSFSANATDALNKKPETPVSESYTMDTTAPTDVTISYSNGGNWVDNVLGAVSFGYYKTPVTVTITAKDTTSPIDYFDWTYTKRADSNNTPATAGNRITQFTQDGATATATFTLTPDEANQYCGNITVTATNKAAHTSAVKADQNRVVVVDNITPTRTIAFTPATQVIDKTTRGNVASYDPNSKENLILFYDAPMNVTLKVTEANFYPQDAVVTVNDKAVSPSWTRSGDEYTADIPLKADGDYVVKMTYSDRSGNVMAAYESSQITIDTVNPVITMEVRGAITGENGGIKYANSNMSAVITIVEHNFRAADVLGTVATQNASEQTVGVADFAGFLTNEANWVTNGDTHVATYPMETDAVYSFQVEYKDLAKRSANAATERYCVDKVAPTNVEISYSTPVLETILEAISLKFYNAQATVTITGVDETSGVSRIEYSIVKANGVSDTNMQVLNQTISEDAITYNTGRRDATTSFKIPASELRAGTQINGTMKLVVFDRAANSAAYENNQRVIVDNIAPQMEIQYNDSTNERDGILYYGEEIHATLRITEANFYKEDVKVTVSRNNGAYEPITVSWSDTNADLHIGTFTLSEDGDYRVAVEYVDKSTNQMESYQSEQMTIDTDMPIVTISGVENKKPYASGTVGFVISVSDTNLDSNSFAPLLTAWVKEGSTIVQKNLTELGAVSVSTDRNSCTYTVENLPEDGIYTISNTVEDMVGHTITALHMESEDGAENEFVRFSVNRNGSTYYIDDQTTLSMLGSFVPYEKAGNVVIREVNPTALSDVSVTMFKDEKTVALAENNGFSFNLNHNDGEWYEYIYTIDRKNFADDGIYSIVLHSKDEAEHVAENNLDDKNVSVSFAIDSTSPVLIVSNLEDGATYDSDNYAVYMQASDNLKLSQVDVAIDGKKVGAWSEAEQNLSADDNYQFNIKESTKAQKVSVSLTDKAGNKTTQDYSVTVTTNAFVRIVNNKPLLFGIVGGATGVVVVPVAGVALFGKKKLFFVLLSKLKGVFSK